MMIKPSWLLSALLIICITACTAVKSNDQSMHLEVENAALRKPESFLADLLARFPEYFDSFVKNNQQYRIQIIYTQITRGTNGMPRLTHHYFNRNPDLYFYPASTVKLPAAVLALQRLNELNIAGLNRNTTMITEAALPGQTAVYNDPSTEDGRPTIANYIKKIFLVSDNDAYNRLYEFLGQEYLNSNLHRLGYDSVQLLHRLQLSLTEEQNRTTNPVNFFDAASNLLYGQPIQKSNLSYHPRQTLLGNGYMNNDNLINQPFDFSKKNRITLADLHAILQSIVLPETVPAKQRFNLKEDDYRFLYRCMSMKPGESSFPSYDSSYADAYVKFLLFGGKGNIENNALRIFNKVGDAYGFLQDVAYIVDFDKGVEFMLSATIYCNADGIFNDDKYDYDTIGLPFLKHLGEVIYNYETMRPKKILPNLSRFVFSYNP